MLVYVLARETEKQFYNNTTLNLQMEKENA